MNKLVQNIVVWCNLVGIVVSGSLDLGPKIEGTTI